MVHGSWNAGSLLHIILDDSALVAAGRGNPIVSQLIAQAHPDSFRAVAAGGGAESRPIARIYVAACALVEADRARPGTGAHAAALPNLEVVPLDLSGALALGGADDWAVAHTLHAARPSLELPGGAVVATASPDRWRGRPVRVLDVTP